MGLRTSSGLVALAALAAALLVPALAQADVQHTVGRGHTIEAIANRYHVTAKAIIEANHLTNVKHLRVGETLTIPGVKDTTAKSEGPAKAKAGPPMPTAADRAANAAAAQGAANAAEHKKGEKTAKAGKTNGRETTTFAMKAKTPGVIHAHRIATTEQFDIHVGDKKGRVSPTALKSFEKMMRSPNGMAHPIDARLVSLVGIVSNHFGSRKVEVVSGFRPFTPTQFNPHSNHMHGKAIDFRIAGVPNEALRDFCRTLKNVGCGYYPNSVFVHMDVRDTSAFWIDYSKPGEAPRYNAPGLDADEGTSDVHDDGHAPAGATGEGATTTPSSDTPSVPTMPAAPGLTAPAPAEPAPAPAPAPAPVTTDRRFFDLRGEVRFSSGHPAGVVLIAAVASLPGEPPILLAAGVAYNNVSVSFTREAFAPDVARGVPVAIPDIHLVVSVENRDGTDLVPVLRHAVSRQQILDGKLGTIVVPLKKGDRPVTPRGLERIPSATSARKRLHLDDELLGIVSLLSEYSVSELTGWNGLLAGVRIEIVDDFAAPLRRRVEALLGRTTFDERENELIEYSGRSLQAYGFWDPLHSVVFLNRGLLEQQSLGFLFLTLGHELVHVGQTKNHPELELEWRTHAAELWRLFLSGKPASKEMNETVFGVMANIEGYADYIERVCLAFVHTCSMQLQAESPIAVPELATPRRAHTEIDVMEEPAAPPSLRTLLISQKWAQYDSGRRAYVKRAKFGKVAPFDPALRPEPILPETVLKPLTTLALGGDAKSQLALGDIYRTGGMAGVTADREKAMRWYKLAAAGGSTVAAAHLAAMKRR